MQGQGGAAALHASAQQVEAMWAAAKEVLAAAAAEEETEGPASSRKGAAVIASLGRLVVHKVRLPAGSRDTGRVGNWHAMQLTGGTPRRLSRSTGCCRAGSFPAWPVRRQWQPWQRRCTSM